MQQLSLIAAMSTEGVIGNNGGLPWHIPEDLAHFKNITSGHAVIMGRKTFESIGRPLPNRENIIVTRNPDYTDGKNYDVVNSLEEGLQLAYATDSRPVVIGGASIYKQALPLVDKMYLTIVTEEGAEGDAYFPFFNPSEWTITKETKTNYATYLELIRNGKDSNTD